MELRAYLEILRRRRLLIAAATVIVASVAGITSSLKTPVYTATAQMLLRPGDPAEELNPGERTRPPVDHNRFLAAQLDIVHSRKVARAAAREVRGANAEELLLQLSARQVGTTDIMAVSVTDPDPARAAQAANAFAGAYIDNRRENAVAGLERASREVEAKLVQVERRLAELDAEIQKQTPPPTTTTTQPPTTTTTQPPTTTTTQPPTTTTTTEPPLRSSASELPATTTTQPSTTTTTEPSTTTTTEPSTTTTTEPSTTTTTKPKATTTTTERKSTTTTTTSRSSDGPSTASDSRPAVVHLGSTSMRLVALREGDREALPATSGRGVVLGQESGNLEALKAARNAAALQYQSLYSRHQELLITMSLKRGEAELIAEAAVPTSPSSPQPLRDLALGAVVGLMLGLGFAFLREQLDDRLHSREEVEEVTNLPVLCELPLEAEAARDQANVSAHARPSGRLAESVRGLRTSLTFVGVDTPLRRILVTSPGQGDGKSFVAVNLATVYAQAGLRTVLVSGDLRRPGLDAHFPEVTPGPGLTEVIAGLTDEAPSPNSQGEASPNGQGEAAAGNRALTTVLRPTRIEGLLFLPTGKLPPNPAELLGSQRAAALLESLSGLADVVVIDTPPVLAVTDAAVLARNADGVVLVAAPGHTHRMALARTATILPAGGVRLLGVVLNKVKSKGSSSYYYGAYYGARTVEQAKPSRLPWHRKSEADAEGTRESSVESSVT